VHIALTGYYGFGNAGDDAILQSIVSSVRSIDPDCRVTVITYPYADLEDVRSLADVEAVDGADLAGIDQAVRQADALIVGGGGLIQDYLVSDPNARFTPDQHNLGFWTTVAALARGRGVPVMTWSIGIGPLTTAEGRDEARLFFACVDTVTVRDEPSADLARALGVTSPLIAADPALLLSPAAADPIAAQAEIEDLPTSGATRIVVSVRHWGDDSWVEPLAAGLDQLVETRDADVIFVPFQQSGRGLANDALMSTKVAARMTQRARRAVLGAESTPAEKLAALASADLVIGMRLHSVIFAAIANVPTVALVYDPKVEIAMGRLGLASQCLAVEGLTSDSIVEAAAAARAADIATVGYLQEAATVPVAALRELLDRPRPVVEPALSVTVQAAVLRGGDVLAARTAEAERDQVTAERDNYQEAYDKLALEYQTVLDSRAVRAARSVWTVRSQLRDLPGLARRMVIGLARRILPGPIRRALRGRIGSLETPGSALTPGQAAELQTTIGADLDKFVDAHRDGPGFVVLPPSIGWEVALFQRPQQIALAFARLGYGVIYNVEAKFAEGEPGYRQVGDGLLVGYLPDELADLLHRVPNPIYLSYVYNFDWQAHLESPITVYEHIDDLAVFEHVYKREQLDEWHQRALAEADVIAASAVDLLNDVRQQRDDAVLVANGVDYEHFAGEPPRPSDLDVVPAGAPIVGYYGALAEWFDYDLVGEAARRLTDFHFVLIGPDYDGTASTHPTLQLPNVHWLGTRPYAELPGYLAAFTVATIPFVVNDVTHAVSPLKLFEYMAGGKPVVTPPLRECSRYRAVQIGEGEDGFVAEILKAVELGADPSHVELLRRTARANTWDARARTIIEAVEGR
jgi:polysaccharide pyruvyl transferase CsaB